MEQGQTPSLDMERIFEKALQDEPPEFWPRMKEEFHGFGPLAPLMEDPMVKEIVVNGCESIWCERADGFELYPDNFLSPITLHNFVHRLSAECGLHLNLQTPCGDSDWRGFRAHLVRPPLVEQWQITLRGRPRDPWTFKRLQEIDWCTPEALLMLRRWLKERKNLLIVGPTGSGKTSVLNACLQELNPEERVICLEDTPELSPRSGVSCRLRTRFDSQGILREFSLGDLLRQALRMRPQRLVMGEVRGGEAKDLLLALATGHRGSLGTLHASDPRQALLRLEMLVQLGAGQWDTQAIRQLIQLSLDGLVMTGLKDGRHTLDGLYRIASLERIGFLLERSA